MNIREASLEDYQQIAAVQQRNGLTIRPYEEWEALWKDNPAVRRAESACPIGWVLETGCGEIVGSISTVPLAYRFRGRNVRTVALCGWAVDATYRSHSIWLLRQAHTQRDVDLYLSTTVSPAAEAGLRVFHWAPAPVGTWNKSAFWITSYRNFVSSLLDAKPVPLHSILRYPLAAVLYCADRIWNAGSRSCPGPCEVEQCSTFDERFDEFWQQLEGRYTDVLLALRSRESLAWHFRCALRRDKVWILAVRSRSRMIGYAIFDRVDIESLGLKRMRLVDFWALDKPGAMLRCALSWTLENCRKEDVPVLEIPGCWLDRPGFEGIRAPHHRTLASCLYYYKARRADLKAALADRKAWLPSSFDGDASL